MEFPSCQCGKCGWSLVAFAYTLWDTVHIKRCDARPSQPFAWLSGAFDHSGGSECLMKEERKEQLSGVLSGLPRMSEPEFHRLWLPWEPKDGNACRASPAALGLPWTTTSSPRRLHLSSSLASAFSTSFSCLVLSLIASHMALLFRWSHGPSRLSCRLPAFHIRWWIWRNWFLWPPISHLHSSY